MGEGSLLPLFRNVEVKRNYFLNDFKLMWRHFLPNQLLSPRYLAFICRTLFKTCFNSICLTVQKHIRIGTIFQKEYSHKESASFRESRNNKTILLEQLLLIFEMIMLLTSHSKDEQQIKHHIDLSVKRSKVNLPATFWLVALYFWRNILTPIDHRYFWICKKIKKWRHSES